MRTGGLKGALLSTLVIVALTVPAISLLSVSPSSAAPEGLTPRAPIYIDGNAGFTPENGVNGGGSGTVGDPHIIENWDISAENDNGIEIRNTTAYFVIRNCRVENGRPDYNGIYLDNVVNGRIENNTCENNSYGIFPYYSPNNIFTNNTCNNNFHEGIFLKGSSSNILINNTCENNKWGIFLYYSSNNTLTNNSCKNIGYGITLYHSDNSTLTNNICRNHGDFGILLNHSFSCTLTNNTCDNNRIGIELYYSSNNTLDNSACSGNANYGISLYGSDNNTLVNNACSNNPYYGIYLSYSSDNNLIYHNNFENNSTQVYDECSNYWDNGYPWGGNYWSDYTGADNYGGEDQNLSGSDRIGDTPYYIPGDNNPDRYPLMNPFPLSWTGWARVQLPKIPPVRPLIWPPPCLYPYSVTLETNLALYQGSKLVLKFYTYGDFYQGENVVWSGTVPDNVSLSKIVPHPEGRWPEKVRLDLTTDDTENVISTVTSFIVRKVDLEKMFTEIPLWWLLSPPEDRVCIEIVFSELPLQWVMAPS